MLRKTQGLDLRVLHESLLRLLKAASSPLQPVTASFLFDSQDIGRNTRAALFASLSMQLLYKRPFLFSKVRHLYRAFESNTTWTEPQLRSFFWTLLCRTNDHQIILVITGLQECDNSRGASSEDLLKFLQAIAAMVQVILSYEGEKMLLNGPGNVVFEVDLDGLEKPANSKGYLEEVTDFTITKRRALGEFKREILKSLDDPGATYSVWARSYLNWLAASSTPSTPRAFRKELGSFPSGEPHSRVFSKPNMTYSKYLWRPSNDRRLWAERALAWISYSCRPLRPRELATALAIDSSTSFNDEVARDIAGDLRRSLAGLVEIAGDEIRLIHPSVRDLELDTTHNTVERGTPRLQAHRLIYRECRSYLLRMNKAYGASNSEDRDGSGEEIHPEDTIRDDLLDYATEYWHVHYRLAKLSGTDDHNVIELLNNS